MKYLHPLPLHRQFLRPGFSGFLGSPSEGLYILDQHLVLLLNALKDGEGIVPISGYGLKDMLNLVACLPGLLQLGLQVPLLVVKVLPTLVEAIQHGVGLCVELLVNDLTVVHMFLLYLLLQCLLALDQLWSVVS
jgi:hypothetical protein